MKKISIFIIGLLCTVFFFSACGNGPSNNYDYPDFTGYYDKYDKPVMVNMIKYLDPTASSNLSRLTAATGETIHNNRWLDAFKDTLNVDVKYKMTGNGDTFSTQWAGLMATGELPDIFPVNLSDYKQLIENDLIWDLTPLYDEWFAPLTKEIQAECGQSIFDAITYNGKKYGVPQTTSQYDSLKYLWIRRDWMANVGVYEAPKTIYELIDLMGKFVNNDPDKNGLKDTTAMSLSNDLWYNLEGLFACFGAYPDSYLKNTDGTYTHACLSDNMREPLQLLQNMFANGWIDQEFPTTTYDKSKANVILGKTGIFMGAHYNAQDFLLLSHVKDKKADWACFNWPGKTETEAVKLEMEVALSSVGPTSVMVVNKNFAHPEALFKMINLNYELQYGETGNYDEYGNDEVDLIWGFGPFWNYRPTINLVPYLDIKACKAGTLNPLTLTGTSKNYYNYVVTLKKYDWNIMFGDLPVMAEPIVNGGIVAGDMLERVVNGTIPSFINAYVGAPTESWDMYGADLATYCHQYYYDVIQGKKNTTTDFDIWVAGWLSGGGQKMLNEIQAATEANGL